MAKKGLLLRTFVPFMSGGSVAVLVLGVVFGRPAWLVAYALYLAVAIPWIIWFVRNTATRGR